ncbi:Protein tas [Monoraphidium neglectum]|uniref:Protein tas n=1 Tax=Monoraphidium neglectum TaxID=145388 RepID=A0A0D2N4N3_9CHLO|nr:Protein tas [Monoraphidium neglectum]KIZ07247.1 Protein tas [Monoraphidium neglectum]|eukprot:XP_013906266.1 Protein tas [Monoraphidium neglectum]
MLFGESTDVATAEQLLDTCLDAGVNFFDAAEMYPVPQRAETCGRSEEVLGAWLARQRRDSIMVATKVAGPSGQMTWIRGGPASLDARNISEALDGSLRRLRTDYIDLYQIHWPDRYVPMFGDVDYDRTCAYPSVPLEEQLEALGRAVAAGKVRHVGLSNETPWGLMNLLCRTFDSGLAEVCHLEAVGLLAYSPLAMGLLTGKYTAPGGGPPEARLNKYGPRPNVLAAVDAYCAIAACHGMSPTELALRFVLGRPLVSSAVVGATSLQQLEELLRAARAPPLAAEVLSEIDGVHERLPNPTP